MTEWQKIAAVMKKVADEPGKWSPKTVEIGMIPKLAEMIKNDYFVIAAASEEISPEGNAKASLVSVDDKKYVLIFPDEKTAEKIGEKPLNCPARELFPAAAGNVDISGLRIVYDVNVNDKTFEAAEIPRKWLLAAVQTGVEAYAAELDASVREGNGKWL